MENNIKNTEIKKSRFNAVDVLVILIILALIFAALYIFDPFSWFVPEGKENVTLRYVVEFKGVDNDVIDIESINIGGTAISSATDYSMGQIVEVKAQESFVWEKMDGSSTMVKKTLADKSDVYITVEVECTFKKGEGYIVNGQQIAHGTLLNLRFENFIGSGRCIELVKVK